MESQVRMMAKLYTSRFGNKELETGKYTVVGIVRGMPRFPVKYKIAGNVIQIAPPRFLWHENNREQFREPYFEHLEKSGYSVIGTIIQKYLNDGKDVVLCCYEDVRKPDEWCHRLVFAEWWYEKTGQKIEELPDPSPLLKKAKREEKQKEPEIGYEQLSFMDDLYRQMYPHYNT